MAFNAFFQYRSRDGWELETTYSMSTSDMSVRYFLFLFQCSEWTISIHDIGSLAINVFRFPGQGKCRVGGVGDEGAGW